ncbi:MAG: hypothetical protein ACRDKJ_11055 [Actinomycetota bacterium]
MALRPATASERIEVEFESDSVGGDGVAGQVIGAVAPGRLLVIANSESSHSTGIGGDARTESTLDIFGLPSDLTGLDRSTQSAGGDGIATQITGVGGSPAPEVPEASPTDGAILSLLLRDIAP